MAETSTPPTASIGFDAWNIHAADGSEIAISLATGVTDGTKSKTVEFATTIAQPASKPYLSTWQAMDFVAGDKAFRMPMIEDVAAMQVTAEVTARSFRGSLPIESSKALARSRNAEVRVFGAESAVPAEILLRIRRVLAMRDEVRAQPAGRT